MKASDLLGKIAYNAEMEENMRNDFFIDQPDWILSALYDFRGVH